MRLPSTGHPLIKQGILYIVIELVQIYEKQSHRYTVKAGLRLLFSFLSGVGDLPETHGDSEVLAHSEVCPAFSTTIVCLIMEGRWGSEGSQTRPPCTLMDGPLLWGGRGASIGSNIEFCFMRKRHRSDLAAWPDTLTVIDPGLGRRGVNCCLLLNHSSFTISPSCHLCS